MDLELITAFEIVYLFYMYFLFKTSYSFNYAIFNENIQSLGDFFIHDTQKYESKICVFGKIMAVIAIILSLYRLDYKKQAFNKTIIFDLLCIFLALLMNFNAFIYIIPLIICEIYIIYNL
jgi:hypothetical protein